MSEAFSVDDSLTSSYNKVNETVSTLFKYHIEVVRDTYTDEGKDCYEGHQSEHETPIDYPLDSVLDSEIGIRFKADGFLVA